MFAMADEPVVLNIPPGCIRTTLRKVIHFAPETTTQGELLHKIVFQLPPQEAGEQVLEITFSLSETKLIRNPITNNVENRTHHFQVEDEVSAEALEKLTAHLRENRLGFYIVE